MPDLKAKILDPTKIATADVDGFMPFEPDQAQQAQFEQNLQAFNHYTPWLTSKLTSLKATKGVFWKGYETASKFGGKMRYQLVLRCFGIVLGIRMLRCFGFIRATVRPRLLADLHRQPVRRLLPAPALATNLATAAGCQHLLERCQLRRLLRHP